MRKLKILQVINRPTVTGGMEIYTLNLSRLLKEKGHHVTLALKPNTEFYYVAQTENFNIIPITRGGAIQPYNIFSIFKFLIKNHCDIIHAHTGNDYWPPLIAKWLSFSNNTQIFVTRHILSKPRNFSSKFYFKNINTICVSKSVYDVMKPYCDIAKTFIVYPGIDFSLFNKLDIFPKYRQKFKIKDNEFVVATMHKWFSKTFPILEKILETLNDVKIIIAGELKEHEINTIESSKFKDKIFICGVIKDMPNFYKSADMFLFPSFDEAFGMVVVEAMASGLPVITTTTGGASEIFEDNTCGFKLDVDNINEFVNAVIKIKNDNKLRLKFSENAKKLALKYDIFNMVSQIENLYYKSLNMLN